MPENKLSAKISGFEYSPVNSPVTNVRISPWEHPYVLFTDFKACALYTFAACPAKNISPQNQERLLLEYSIFKRKILGENSFPDNAFTPFSFAILLFCELVNEDKFPPETALPIMLKLIESSDKFGFSSSEKCSLFGYITDFCLINRLEIPFPENRDGLDGSVLLREMLMHRFYCEYYRNKDDAKKSVTEIVPHICGYDYKNSAAYEANPAVYENALRDCFVAYIDNIRNNRANELVPECLCLTYPAYVGLAIYHQKAARITVTIRNYSQSPHICSVAPELAKYIDNTLRRGFDIKCKIPGIHIAPELRSMVQHIICTQNPGLFKKKKRGRKPKEKSADSLRRSALRQSEGSSAADVTPALVKPVRIEVDLENAKLLEKQSWDIAKLLGVEYDDDPLQNDFITVGEDGTLFPATHAAAPSALQPTADVFTDEWQELYSLLDKNCRAFLKLALQGANTTALQSFALSVGGLADAFAAEINEISSGITGDILIEGSALIRDYADDVKRMFELYGKEN